MGTPQTPRPRKSPWARYAPFIAIVAIIGVVVAVLALTGGDDGGDDDVAVDGGGGDTSSLPVLYTDAQADGTVDDYTWQEHCNTDNGLVAIAVNQPIPCVPKFEGTDNGGETSPGVTADKIRVGYYMQKPDPALDALAKAAGAYDE